MFSSYPTSDSPPLPAPTWLSSSLPIFFCLLHRSPSPVGPRMSWELTWANGLVAISPKHGRKSSPWGVGTMMCLVILGCSLDGGQGGTGSWGKGGIVLEPALGLSFSHCSSLIELKILSFLHCGHLPNLPSHLTTVFTTISFPVC